MDGMTFSLLLRGLSDWLLDCPPVGPIGVLCIRGTLAEGRTAGVLTGLGAATADALYGCIAAFGLTFISAFLVSQQDLLAMVDHYSWYTLAFKESHDDWSVSAGWSWVTYWPDRADFAVGLGYTAFIMTRPDIFNGVPFPAILPIASVKLGPAEIMGTFIPKLNGGVNHGNVAYFFGRIQF